MVNAVVHGKLCLSYTDTSCPLLLRCWEQEVVRRLALPAHSARAVEVRFARQDGEIRFVIRDQGDGFDGCGDLAFAPERVFDLHGGGIGIARNLSFDSVEYQGKGNTAAAIASPKATGMDTPNPA